MNSIFELPIFYIENKEKVDGNIIDDLELLELTEENEERKSLLETVIKPKSKIGIEHLNKLCEYYTNNKLFLKQTQEVIAKWEPDEKLEPKQDLYDNFYDLWKNIKTDDNFIDRYYYVDVDFFKFLNNSSPFLQLLSIYNLVSPILSLILPIILLIVPFFMLKFSGVAITMESYYKVLINIFSKHALGNIFTIMDDISMEKKIYAIVSVLFYFFSIYQNTLVCYRFYKNFKSIHDDLFLLKDYLITSVENMNILEKSCIKHNTYMLFLQSMYPHKDYCVKLIEKLDKITAFKASGLTAKSREIGYIMKYFYEIHTNNDLQTTIEYTFGMNSFMEHMNGLNTLYREKLINKCKFGKKTKLVDTFYPYLIDNNPIKNTIDLSKNIAITGPNASGKTTVLKTVLLNLIFSQNFGLGFYSKATICLYNRIHCYLNIPDTSGRDSLFQAEARRCKEIIDSLEETDTKHFCIFDELFSGTNPNEACASSYGFVKYLISKKNIDFVLTTHLLDLCKIIEPTMKNSHMNVKKIDDFNFDYTYQIKSGISDVKGGLKVLFDLHYPQAVLDESNKVLNKSIK